MRLISVAERREGLVRVAPGSAGNFHGEVMQETVHQTDQPMRVTLVHFVTGAHTMWHSHSGGQILHILDGQARVCAWGEDEHRLIAGDTVVAPPGEKHWHGAAPNVSMTQLAITSGDVERFEDVEA